MEYEKATKDSKSSRENNSETVTNKNGKEIPKGILKERYISLEERQKSVDNLDINIVIV